MLIFYEEVGRVTHQMFGKRGTDGQQIVGETQALFLKGKHEVGQNFIEVNSLSLSLLNASNPII